VYLIFVRYDDSKTQPLSFPFFLQCGYNAMYDAVHGAVPTNVNIVALDTQPVVSKAAVASEQSNFLLQIPGLAKFCAL